MSYLFGGTPFDGYSRDGRRTVNGDGGGGNSGPQQVTQTTSNIPDWLKGPTQKMVARGEALSEQPYQAYTGERVADFTPAQQAAFQQIYGMAAPEQYGQATSSIAGAQEFGAAGALQAMGYQPTAYNQYQMGGPQAIGAGQVGGTGYEAFGAQAAPDVTGTSYQAALANYTPSWNQETAQQYMSPYQQAVTDIAKREAIAESAGLNKQLSAQAAKAGAFGGSRFGVEQGLLDRKSVV